MNKPLNVDDNLPDYNNPYDPYDPMCQTFARDMDYIDFYKGDSQTRVDFIIYDEGTYNRANGHFLCDDCYIKAGMPSSRSGWVCP